MTDKNKPSYFLKNNLSVFECSSNRRPIAKGWRDLEYWMIDAEEADQWKCYGVAIESGWLVIDVDLRKEEAHDSFARLSAFVDFSEAFRCKTARGGFHYWFKNPTEQPIRKNVHCQDENCKDKNHYHGIDFLSDGCYVIGSGSIADTGVYSYEAGELGEAGDASSQLLTLLEKREVDISKAATNVETSLEVTRYKQWLDAQPGSILGQNSNDYTYNMAAYGFDFGLSEQEVFEAMWDWNETCTPPWPLEKLRVRVANAAKYAQNAKGKAAIQFEAFTSDQQEPAETEIQPYVQGVYDDAFYDGLHPGVGLTYRGDHILPSASNIRIVLLGDRYRGLFTWDAFRHKIVLDRVPPWRNNKADISLDMHEMDWREIRIDLSMQARLDAPTYMLEDAIYSLANAQSFHPVCDWLNTLRWDGEPRLHRIFGLSEYKITIAKIFLLAAIYRMFYPGYKFDHMLVITGAQGIGKSYLVQVLGGELTTVLTRMPTDRKGQQELEGGWWIEFPEMSALKKIDINSVKAFITMQVDSYIPMYGRHGVQRFPRTFIPVWTLNPTEAGFIVDDTNRRFLIVEQKESLNIEYIKEHRNQIYAEVMELYRKGIQPHKLVELIAEEAEKIAQANRQDESDVWEELIQEWITNNNLENTRITTKQVYTNVLGAWREIDYDKASQMRIGKSMKRLGWTRKTTMGNSYYVKEDYETLESDNNSWDIEV